MACCISCSTLLSFIILVILGAYLVYVIASVPTYRYVAIIGILLLIIFQTSAWRFLPSERAYVKERAKSIVNARLAYLSPTGTV